VKSKEMKRTKTAKGSYEKEGTSILKKLLEGEKSIPPMCP